MNSGEESVDSEAAASGHVQTGRSAPVALLIRLGTVVIIAAVLAVMLAGNRRELAEMTHELAAVTDELHRLRAAEEARRQEAAARPDVGENAQRWLGGTTADVTGDESTATVRIRRVDDEVRDGLEGLLDELGFSSAVRERMARTRALDGTQRADGHNVNVTWTYHPDHGLSMVFEAQ